MIDILAEFITYLYYIILILGKHIININVKDINKNTIPSSIINVHDRICIS